MEYCTYTFENIFQNYCTYRINCFNTVYYRVYNASLALKSEQWFNEKDKSIGRVVTARIISPPTVGDFKLAVAQLENIDESRIAALRITPGGEDASDTTILTPASTSLNSFPKDVFSVILSRVTNGIAAIVPSQTEPHKAAYSGMPEGWVVASILNRGTPQSTSKIATNTKRCVSRY